MRGSLAAKYNLSKVRTAAEADTPGDPAGQACPASARVTRKQVQPTPEGMATSAGQAREASGARESHSKSEELPVRGSQSGVIHLLTMVITAHRRLWETGRGAKCFLWSWAS